jgi:hypothetical protein
MVYPFGGVFLCAPLRTTHYRVEKSDEGRSRRGSASFSGFYNDYANVQGGCGADVD